MSKRKPLRLVQLLLLALPCATFAAAQTRARPGVAAPRPAAETQPARQPAAAQTPAPSRDVSPEEADVAITANVTATSLRFDVVPNVNVEFKGRPKRDTVWDAERTNLPRPVQPGVTYRDVGIRLKIVSVFADIDRIVAEALGEVPPTDDAPPTPNVPPPNTPTVETPAGATAANGRARGSDELAAATSASAAHARPRADAGRRRTIRRAARTGLKGRPR